MAGKSTGTQSARRGSHMRFLTGGTRVPGQPARETRVRGNQRAHLSQRGRKVGRPAIGKKRLHTALLKHQRFLVTTEVDLMERVLRVSYDLVLSHLIRLQCRRD